MTRTTLRRTTLAAFALTAGLAAPQFVGAALIFQVRATGYDAATSTLTPDVGPALTQLGPDLTAGAATPNGSSSLHFDGATTFSFANDLVGANGGAYTIFAYLRPTTADVAPKAIVAGLPGSVEYRFSGGDPGEVINAQVLLRTAQQNFGHSETAVIANQFNSINVANEVTDDPATTGRVSFRADGVTVGDVGSTAAIVPSQGFARLGSRNDPNGSNFEFLVGDLAEVRIYDTVLTVAERQGIESQFTASYVTAVPEPSSALALLGLGAIGLVGHRRRIA